jgi:phenylpyruvate tautomerase PptA (4-oxalocrotonate tautomerase family)
MPIVFCHTQVGLEPALKQRIASGITEALNTIVKSPLEWISVVFDELLLENSYIGGKPGRETVIVCNIRYGRSDEAKQRLAKRVSAIWSESTGLSEDHIEVVVKENQAKDIVRGGQTVPEPPIV